MGSVEQGLAVFALMTAVGVIAGAGARLSGRAIKSPNRFRPALWVVLVVSGVVYLVYEVTSTRHSLLGIGVALCALCVSVCDVVFWRRTRR